MDAPADRVVRSGGHDDARMKIPYGQSHFATIRREGLFYVDTRGTRGSCRC
jgi:hypothetical protein